MSSTSRITNVSGYRRANGTYVSSYSRSKPDGLATNNLGYKGSSFGSGAPIFTKPEDGASFIQNRGGNMYRNGNGELLFGSTYSPAVVSYTYSIARKTSAENIATLATTNSFYQQKLSSHIGSGKADVLTGLPLSSGSRNVYFGNGGNDVLTGVSGTSDTFAIDASIKGRADIRNFEIQRDSLNILNASHVTLAGDPNGNIFTLIADGSPVGSISFANYGFGNPLSPAHFV